MSGKDETKESKKSTWRGGIITANTPAEIVQAGEDALKHEDKKRVDNV